MDTGSSALEMPSFLIGPYASVHRKAMSEGRRCAGQYRKNGSVTAPRQMLRVPPGEVVIMAGVVDFQREQPGWRLYMVSDVVDGLCRALDWRNSFQVSDVYEALCRETAWARHWQV